MEKWVYIDGDILPYRVGFATQRTVYIVDIEGEHSCSPFFTTASKRRVNKYLDMPEVSVTKHFVVEEPIQAINTLKLNIQGIVRGCKATHFKVVLSGENNFREDIATIQKYKGNRDGSVKPVHWQMLRDWLADMPYTIIAEGEEADDVLSRAMMAGHIGATIDKDLDNTPGKHYNFNRKEIYDVTPEQAMRNFYTQCLTGDTADNIPGIRGIGPATARKLLDGCRCPNEYEDILLRVYGETYNDPYDALTEVGRLLWMRREEGEMWEPSISS
jgi:DNA polymerase-1